MTPTLDLGRKLTAEQFPEFSHLQITDVEKQGHDNRTYRLGDNMLIRKAVDYALKVPKEQDLLPQLAKRLSVSIPAPIKMGKPSTEYPYPFFIYKWLPGKSINLLTLTEQEKEQLAVDLAKFLKELQAITDVEGPGPGQHNWWLGDHFSVYDKGSYAIKQLSKDIDLQDDQVIKNYEFSESIASRFSALGIPAVSAIENTGQYLFMGDETGFLLYPWVDAKALDQNAV